MRALAFKYGVNTKKQRQAKLWQRVAMLLTAFVVMGSGLAQMALAAPGDYNWQKAGVTGIVGDAMEWTSVASSADGSKLVATERRYDNGLGSYIGSIYTSTDSGATWTERTAAGSREWRSVASSADGTRLVAVETHNNNGLGSYIGSIYTSTDSGATWTERTAAGSRSWDNVVMSADGIRIVAVEQNYGYMGSEGYIYTSEDGGVTWAEQTAAGWRNWRDVAMSADGTKLASVVSRLVNWVSISSIYLSADSGATWTEQTAAGSREWTSVAISADGSKLVATERRYDNGLGSYIGSIYTTTDSGVTWTEQPAAGSRDWTFVASSADGSKLVAIAGGGSIYTSTDSGANWTERTAAGSRDWTSVASSSDGSKLVAAARGGSIYTSTDSGATWVAQLVAGSSGDWSSVASSSEGSKLVAASGRYYGDDIYLGTLEGPATAKQDMTSLPVGSKDTTAAPAIAGASLAATSMSCYTLKSGTVSTLGPDSLVLPEPGVSLLGGMAFSLDCTSAGGSADTAITLGTSYANVADLRVYKHNGTSPLTDITKRVTIQNEDGKTVIRYNLTDGGTWDEDGIANGAIVDPIYVGVVQGASTTSTGSLANTGLSIYPVAALAGALLVSAGLIWHKGLKIRKPVSFR